MSTAFYQLVAAGTSPLTVTDVKAYLRITTSADDTLLQIMIDAATEFGEQYTGRAFRANQWELFLDKFDDAGIYIRKDPVDTVDSIEYLKDDTFTTVASTVYYLKLFTQNTGILLRPNQEWPTDIDDIEQAIKVAFTTKSYFRTNQILLALMRHVTYWYKNRGDCDNSSTGCDCSTAAASSGATLIYDQFRISRV